MKQKIIDFHPDEQADWIADLAYGHTQHVLHNPPWQNQLAENWTALRVMTHTQGAVATMVALFGAG